MAPQSELRYATSSDVVVDEVKPTQGRWVRPAAAVSALLVVAAVAGYSAMPSAAPVAEVADVVEVVEVADTVSVADLHAASEVADVAEVSASIPTSGMVFKLDAATANSPTVIDEVYGIQFNSVNVDTASDGTKYWNLDSTVLTRSGGGSYREGQYYTHAYVLKWRESNSGWRTLLRHSQDHCQLIQSGSIYLGMYSNRNGGWRQSTSGYSIDTSYSGVGRDSDRWRVVVYTGQGDSSTSTTGTTTFYTSNADNTMTQRGTSDRVCSGMDYQRVGWPGQAPGLVSKVIGWNRVLSSSEIQGLGSSMISACAAGYYLDSSSSGGDNLMALRMTGTSSTWRYDNAVWSSSSLFTSGNDAKYEPFNTPCNTIRVDFYDNALSSYKGQVSWTHNLGRSLQDIFSSNTFYSSSVATSTWRNSGGSLNFPWQSNCNTQGFNANAASATYTRFGINMNQEGDCNSPDTSIGIGLNHRGYSQAYNGAGYNCCQNGGGSSNVAAGAIVYVSGCTVQPSCLAYGGSCANGALRSQSQRTAENQCASCNNGYYLSGTTCYAWGGSCSSGALITQSSRRQNNHCGSCNNGYYLSGVSCYAWGGSCSNGALITQSSRRQNDHCGSCNSGYYLSGNSCAAWGGTCTNGVLVSQTSRRQENHCASCDAGFSLDSAASPPNCAGFGGECANGSLKPQAQRAGPGDCGSCNSGYYLTSSGSGTIEDGCDGTGWSNTECTNVGNSGTMHGPWGNDVRTVSKTISLSSGVSSCTVAWRSWSISSRDNEVDSVYLDGAQVWSMAMNTGTSGRTADAKANWATYEQSYCWAGCIWYSYVDVSHTVSCSGSLSVEFRSNIDQGESDEAWAFQNFALTTGGGQATSCEDLYSAGSTASGTYTIYPSGSTGVSVYCDMTTDGGGYDMLSVSGTSTCRSTDSNSCPAGMDIWVPRSRAHLVSARSQFGDTFVDLVGVSRAANGCGTCTSYAMNSVDVNAAVAANSGLGPAWQAVDGGSWYMRATTHSEPNGDYSSDGWLENYWFEYLDTDSNDIGFNDGGAQCHSNYICSTNSKDPNGVSGPVQSCTGYEGTCSNGSLRSQSQRTADNQCVSCDNGYYLSGTTCNAWGGSCSNGVDRPQSLRSGVNQCASNQCYDGYYFMNNYNGYTYQCVAWAGDCTNGGLITQSSRRQQNHCGSCNPGYYISGSSPPTCPGWGGTCANGNIMPQTSRRQENHCQSCHAGYYMSGTNSCEPWGGSCSNGHIKDQQDRVRHNDCQWCNDGYYLSGHSCINYAGSCANGNMKPQDRRLRDSHCDSCVTGSVLHGLDQPSHYTVSLSGVSSSQAMMEEGVTAFTGSAAVLSNVPDEILGSKLLQLPSTVAAGTQLTVSANEDSDVYFFYEDNGAIQAPSTSAGWSELPGMAYSSSSYSSCNSAGVDAGCTNNGGDDLALSGEVFGCYCNVGTFTCAGCTVKPYSSDSSAGFLKIFANAIQADSITADGAGYPGGASPSTANGSGNNGQGDGAGAAGGGECGGQGRPAGGAGHGTAGEAALNNPSGCGGAGGVAYDSVTSWPAVMAMGSGGGSGGNDNVLHDNPVGGAGGCGGGIILLQATTVSITGTLSANGEDGVGDGTTDVFALGAGCGGGSTDCYYDYSGAGGGGSGGSIAIITDSGTANSSPACPTPAAFDAGTSYPVHNGSGDNYYNYCNYMVTSGCTDMCTGALAGACRNECTAVGARRRVTEAQGDEVPGGAALSYRGGFGGAGVSATDASRRAGDGGAGLYLLSQLQATSTPMRVFRYTQQAGCGTRNPQCSTSLALPTPSSSAHMGVAVDLTGFTCAGCAAGYYQSGSSCAPYGGTCANGDLIAQGDRTQQNHCGTCDPGYFLSSAECHPYGGVCTNGVLLPQAQRRMTNHCDQCDAGYTKQGTYPPVCNACLPGTITAERGTSPCVDCIAGQYQNQAAQDNCIVCADGYYSANAGSATCTTCGDGYEPNGCTAADMAAAGTEAVGIAEDGCDGTGWSNTECTNVGNSGTMHGPWGNDVRTVSKTFPLASGVSSCTVSWRSWGISSRDNEMDSVLLDGNQVWSMRMNTGTSGRTADAKANWANYEQSYCWAGCNWYRYVDVSHSVPCSGSLSVEFRSAIDQGESDESWAFQNFAIATIGGASSGMSPIPASCTGSKTQCDICPIGKASHNGDAKCVACVPGYFAATTGTRDCAACAAGKKQPQSEQGGCVDCAPGKYQQTQAQTVCHNCNVGRVAPTAGMPTCDLCVPGKVMPSTGQTRCNDCRIGEYQPNHAQTHCPLCAPGWVTPREGMPTCDACARGKYQDHSGQGTCIDCFMGYVAPNEAQPTCDACHPGEFMDERGQRHCKDCAQPAGAYPANAKTFTSYDSPSHGPATANGFFTNYYAAAICTAWTECQPGHHIAFGGSATVDRTCVPCEPEHWSKSSGCNGGCDTPDQINEPVCTEWSVCPGNHAADYQDGDHGLTVLGTPTTDAVCTPCAEGSITIIDDFYSPCYNLLDIDGDSKYDRFIYDDLRHQGQRARRLGRGPYVPEADFDRHVHPDTGGEYDRCPFDPMNDEDGDGICALRTPPRLAHFVDNDANRFYAPGGSRQDHCPLDSDNDKDKDGLCDDVDRKVVTWDFTSANLVGWKDATCDGEPYHLGAADDACPEPTDFAVAAPERAVPALEIDAFGNDYRMSQMCDFSKGSDHRRRLSVQAAEMTAETELAALPAHEEGAFVIASFDLEEVITCDGLCQDHGMVCTAAVGGARHSRFTPFYNFAGPYTYDSDSANSVRRGVCDGDAVWDETYNKCGCPDDVCADQDACESVCGAIGDCAMFEFLEEAVSGGMRCWMIADADVDVEASCDPTVDFCMMLDVSGAACPAGQWLNEQSRCVHPPANFDTVRGCPAAAARGECFDEWTASNCALSCNNACDEVDMDAAQGDCGAFATRLMCKCEPDPRPMKLESWSQHNTCDSCYASTAHDDAVTGTMEREITIKKNTLTFALKGEQSLSKFVKLTIKNTKANQEHKAYKDQPFIMETPDATDGDWYPVNWDLSEFVGRKAKIEVTDVDPNGGVSVDEFTWFSERSSCLPSCMAIRDGICSGETCFYFENDNRAYVNVKQISDLEATYCRQGPLRDGGSPIGGGIREMWIDNGPNPVLLGPDGEEISGGRDVAIARTDSLRSDVLPRCFNIELKGSHISVTVAEGILGDDKPRRSFAYAPAPQLSEQAHCVYPTLKARCVAHSKPSAAFDEQKAVLCNPMIYRPTCFDQCYSLHCPFDDEQACGNSKAFQDCATCCDNNSNEASGCFRRRRRLGSKGAGSKATMLLNEDESTYTDNECAAACLDMDGCIGFKVEKGACMLTDQCGKENNDGTFERGTWHIHIEEEVMVGGKRQRKRLRKKRRSVPQPPTPGGPETPALCSNDCDGHPCAYCDETGCCTSDAEGSYCRNQNPTAAVTCSGADPEGTVDDNGMPVCCQAMTAECGACKNGLTTDGFCNACAFHGLNALECDDCASIMPVTPSGECPVGMRIVGNPGADIGGCGLQGCGERYDLTTIDQCAQRCQSTAGCNAINWADFGQDRNHVGQQVCTLYTQDQPTSTWGNQQLFCAYELTVGGTQDRYGCIGSAGYVYCHSSQRCQRPWEEDCLDEIVPPHMPEPEPTCEACHASAVYDHLTIHGAPMPFKVNDDGTYDVPRDCSVGLAELAEYGLVNLRDDFYDGCSGDETYDCNMDTAMALLDVCDYDTGRISIPVPCPEPPTPFPTAPGGEIETTDCEPAWDEGQNFFGINRHYYEGHMALFEVGREIIADGTSYYIDAMNLPGNCNSAVALVYVANDQSCADGSPWVNTPECGFGGALTATLRAGMTWSLPAEPVDPCTDGYFASPDLNDIGGCGLQSCGERYSLYNIDQCAARCNALDTCLAYSWAELGEDRNHADQKVCTLYDSVTPNQNWAGTDGTFSQLFCAVPELVSEAPLILDGTPLQPLILDGTPLNPNAEPCRVMEPASGNGGDCWELTPWLEANGLPASDCSKYFDTYGGGRGCRIEDGRCDGFADEEYTECV